MRNLGEIFDRMFYWEIANKKLTLSGRKIGKEYDIKVIKVEGSGSIPYNVYGTVVEKATEDMKKYLKDNPDYSEGEDTVNINLTIPDPLGFLRLLNKMGFIEYERFEIKP